MTDKDKRPRGRPVKREPERIPDSFENVLKAVLQPTPPPQDREVPDDEQGPEQAEE